jgi:hypothetical protein
MGYCVERAVTCAPTPTFEVPLRRESEEPLVWARQHGIEQRCPVRFASSVVTFGLNRSLSLFGTSRSLAVSEISPRRAA